VFKVVQFGWGIYLCLLAIIDIRYRKISLFYLLTGIVVAILLLLTSKDELWMLSLGGAVVGLAFILVSKVTKEALGYGDSILILILGISLGFWRLMYMMIVAFFLAAIFALMVLTLKKMKRQSSFAFIPFLAASYVICNVLGGF